MTKLGNNWCAFLKNCGSDRRCVSTASQEFLASFAVEIDEAGVSRLQQVLEENRELANKIMKNAQ